MFGLKKKSDYSKSRALSYEEKIEKLSHIWGCQIAGWLAEQATLRIKAERMRNLKGSLTQEYVQMRTKMIMQANGGSFYTDDEIYYNLECMIASKRFELYTEIKNNKYNTGQTVQILDMAESITLEALFESISNINKNDLVNNIVRFDEELQKDAMSFVNMFAQNHKPQGYDPTDEKQLKAFEEECDTVGRYIYKYIQDKDVVSKLIDVFFKAVGCNWTKVKDISELSFVNEFGQFIDDDKNPILEAGIFDRNLWGLNSEDEILYKYLDMGYDLRGKMDPTWKIRGGGIINDEKISTMVNNPEFPYNMLVSREDAPWRF